jgi:hypothetical protein
MFAVPLVNRISGVKIVEKSSCGPAEARAVGAGRATARFFGTSSPKTIDTEVAIRIARNRATTLAACSGRPMASRPGCSSRATTGSAR